MRVPLAVVGLSALMGAACATPSTVADRLNWEDLERRAGTGEAEAAHELALEIVWRGQIVGRLHEAQSWAKQAMADRHPGSRILVARITEALGEKAEAFEHWLHVAESAQTKELFRAYALARIGGLVDDIALRKAHVARLLKVAREGGRIGASAARAAERAARRLSAWAELEEARQAMGAVRSYRRSGRLSALPAVGLYALRLEGEEPGRSQPLLSPEIATPDGTVSFAEDGSGIYLAVIRLGVRKSQKVVRVEGVETLAAGLDGREIARFEGLRNVVPTVVRFILPRGPAGVLRLHVGSRSAAPQVRVMIRDKGESELSLVGEGRLEQLAILELSVADGDVEFASTVADVFSGEPPIAALALAELRRLNPTAADSERRGRFRPILRDALRRAPGLMEARVALVQALYQSGEAAHADALLRDGLKGGTVLEIGRASERGDRALARRLALGLIARQPTSCKGYDAYLSVNDWRLRFRRDRWFEKLPGCYRIRLRAAEILRTGWRNEAAYSLLSEALRLARPGSERARVKLAMGQTASSQGRYERAERDLQEGLQEGVHRIELLDALSRLRILTEDAEGAEAANAELVEAAGRIALVRREKLDPIKDLGLPLTDGLALARAAMARRGKVGLQPSVNILLKERHTRVLRSGLQIHREHHVAELLDDGALEKFGEIPLPEGAQILIARTYKPTPDGDLQPIEPEEIPEKSSISLPALSPGAIIEVAWVWHTPPSSLLAPHWTMPAFHFDSLYGPVERAQLLVRVPRQTRHQVQSFGQAPYEVALGEGLRSYTVMGSVRARVEPLDPRPELRRNMIQISSSFDARALRDMTLDAMAENLRITPAVRDLARRLTSKAQTEGQRLEAIYRGTIAWILDASPEVMSTHAARAVARRIGDRSVVLSVLCKAAELDCDLVLVEPRFQQDPSGRELLDLDRFIYPVVRARVEGTEIWLAPNNRFTPFGYLPPLIRDATGLILRRDGAPLVRTPATTGSDGRRHLVCEGHIKEPPKVELLCREEYTGLYSLSWRRTLSQLDKRGRGQRIEQGARRILPGASVHSLRVENLEEVGKPLVLSWTAESKLMDVGDGVWALSLGLSPANLTRRTVKIPSRRSPFFNLRTSDLTLDLQLRVDAPLVIERAPTVETIAHPIVQMERDVELSEKGRVLRIHKEFHLDADRILPEDYGRWAQTARRIDAVDRVQILIRNPRPQEAK